MALLRPLRRPRRQGEDNLIERAAKALQGHRLDVAIKGMYKS